MKIGIYTFDLREDCSGGVNQYSARLIYGLVRYTNNDIYVFTNKKLAKHNYLIQNECKNYHEIILPNKVRFYRKLFYNRYSLKTPIPYFLDRLYMKKIINTLLRKLGDVRLIINDYKLDVLHVPIQTLPLYNWRLPTLISLHDLQHEYLPEFFTRKQLKWRGLHYKKSAKNCSQIIVSFNHVKEDIVKFYNIDPKKITVTSIGYDFETYSNSILNNSYSIINKFKIPEKFLLYPAQTWRHKNHIFLLKALAKYKEKYDRNIFLVCTGIKNKFYKDIEKVITIEGLKKNVIFTGFLPEEDLYALYSKAKLVVIPTLYEAGCYPLIEAMIMSVPVICSDVTTLPETLGDERFVFNPKDEDKLCKLIYKMLNDESFRKENILNSKKKAQGFKWNKVIDNFIFAYQKAILNYKNEI